MLRMVEGVSAKDLKSLADEAKAKLGSGVVAFIAVADGRASLVVGVTDDLKARINAVDLVKRGAEALGGKGGGGRPDLAQAGGPDGTKAQDALTAIERRLGRTTARLNWPSPPPPAVPLPRFAGEDPQLDPPPRAAWGRGTAERWRGRPPARCLRVRSASFRHSGYLSRET